MKKREEIMGVALLLAGVSGCSGAHIALSPQLAAAAEPVALTGMGYGQTGRFVLAGSSGTFTRKAMSVESAAPFPVDGITSHEGGGSFAVSGPDFTGDVRATCRYFEAERTAGAFTTTIDRFRYRCTFVRDGRPIAAELRLTDAPRSPGKLLSAVTRVGQLRIGDEVVAIDPIHQAVETRVPSGSPLGYRFVRDGREIGAIDLNGRRKTIFAPRNGLDRETVLIGSLALSILWHG